MFENHLKGLILQHNFNFRAKNNVKINWCKNSFHFDDFVFYFWDFFLLIFKHCANWTNIFKVWKIIKTLSRFPPPIAMKHYCRNRISKLRRHQEFPGARLKNCNAIGSQEEVLGKYRKGRKDQEEGCCSVHFRQTNSKELGARG